MSSGKPKMKFAFTLQPAFTACRIEWSIRSVLIFFLMRMRISSLPLSGAYVMFVQPDLTSSGSTSSSSASERVPDGSCHVIFRPSSRIRFENSITHSFLMIAVRS